MKWTSILLTVLCATPLSANADQFEWVNFEQATAAQKILLKSHEVQEFCAPCGA